MSQDREVVASPLPVPASLAPLVEGRNWARDTVGEAGAVVHRLYRGGEPDLYLKHGACEIADAILYEGVRMRWLGRHRPTPAVRALLANDKGAWLLMSAVRGQTAYQMLEGAPEAERGAIVDLLASDLRALHALPAALCPFDSGHAVRLAQARARIDAGLVDCDDFDDARQGWTAEQVWAELTRLTPPSFDRVVTHGDYSLDNILVADGRVAGLIDLGRVGVADQYQDLAILWNCLGEFGAALQARLFAAYGIAAPDERRLHYHLCLDELF